MSVEDRLLALTQQCRQQNGDAFLANASLLAPRLNAQAPDLHAEIRALAVAFEIGAVARINASPQPDAEAAAIASEIAVRERLSLASVTPAVTVARRIGPLMAAPAAPAAPAAGGWAGDSVAVGGAGAAPAAPAYQQPPVYTPPHAPHPQPQPQAGQSYTDKIKALSKNPMAMGALALVLGFLVYQNMRSSEEIQTQPFQQGGDTQQPPFGGPDSGGQQPPVFGGGGAGGGGAGGTGAGAGAGGGASGPGQLPVLGAAGSGPTLPVQQHQSGGPAIGFALSTPRGPAPGMVLLPAGGWQSGPVNFGLAQPGDTSGQSFATIGQGQFQLIQSGGHPVRLAQIQMSQDSLGIGNACVMFRGQQGQQDVQLSGADFCVMDGPCSRTLGCGRLQ